MTGRLVYNDGLVELRVARSSSTSVAGLARSSRQPTLTR